MSTSTSTSTSTEALLAERPAPLALLVLHQSGPNQLLHYCDTDGAQSSSKQKPKVQLVLVLVLVVPFVCPCSKEQDAVQLLYLLCCPCTTVLLEGTTRERLCCRQMDTNEGGPFPVRASVSVRTHQMRERERERERRRGGDVSRVHTYTRTYLYRRRGWGRCDSDTLYARARRRECLTAALRRGLQVRVQD